MSEKGDFKHDILPVLFLTVVVCIAVIALVMTNAATYEKIEDGKLKETIALLSEQFPEMTDYETDGDMFVIFQDQTIVGFAFNTVGKGYGGNIDILVAVDNTADLDEGVAVLRGISIIKQSETPGLGTKITQPSFTQQFDGVYSTDISLSRDGGDIDAITGATISSRAVTDAVASSVDAHIPAMQAVRAEVD